MKQIVLLAFSFLTLTSHAAPSGLRTLQKMASLQVIQNQTYLDAYTADLNPTQLRELAAKADMDRTTYFGLTVASAAASVGTFVVSMDMAEKTLWAGGGKATSSGMIVYGASTLAFSLGVTGNVGGAIENTNAANNLRAQANVLEHAVNERARLIGGFFALSPSEIALYQSALSKEAFMPNRQSNIDCVAVLLKTGLVEPEFVAAINRAQREIVTPPQLSSEELYQSQLNHLGRSSTLLAGYLKSNRLNERARTRLTRVITNSDAILARAALLKK